MQRRRGLRYSRDRKTVFAVRQGRRKNVREREREKEWKTEVPTITVDIPFNLSFYGYDMSPVALQIESPFCASVPTVFT